MIQFSIPMKPKAKERPRFGQGHAYSATKTKGAEKLVKEYAEAATTAPIEGPVDVAMWFQFAIPQSWSKAKKANPPACTKRPDLDNLAKLVMDAIQGVVFADDASVTSLQLHKSYGPTDGIFVRVKPAEKVPPFDDYYRSTML